MQTAEPLPTMDQLSDELREVAILVNTAQERTEERDYIESTHAAVMRVESHYRALYASLSEIERMKIDRQLGRRLTDIMRQAATLPRPVTVSTGSTPDRRVEGASEVGERRITGVHWRTPERGFTDPARPKVGGEIESWCGKCGKSTTHHVVAMVGSEPKQVLCLVCSSRHTHRTGPARGKAEEAPVQDTRRQAADPEAQRRADAQKNLSRELAEAASVKAFDAKERYRPGDVIAHPQFGRGKVENVLRSSMLVRFQMGGLKSIMLS